MVIISKESSQIRILKLVDGEHNDGVLYRLQKGWSIHFMLGPTLASRNVSIYCNIPNDGDIYDRIKYRLLKWKTKSLVIGDKLDYYAAITLTSSGSFQYYFTYDGEKHGSGYFIVDPSLTVGADELDLPLDAVCMQTVLPKSLGLFSTWKDRLLVSKESGYNVIHFTPIQELGISNSSYSLADQLALNPNFSGEEKLTFDNVKDFVEELRRDWAMLSVTDVVWNHTAKNSPWLKLNPECGYNLHNSPHLRPAYVLDRGIFHLSVDISKGKYKSEFPEGNITTNEHVETISKILETDAISPLKLHEFFQVDIDEEVLRFQKKVGNKSTAASQQKSEAKISIMQDQTYRRFGCHIDLNVAVHQFHTKGSDPVKVVEAFRSTLIWLNKIEEERIAKEMKGAIENILSTIRYERLADHGPKVRVIDKDHPIVTTYFNHPFPDTSAMEEEAEIMEHPQNCKLIMACNGWVMGADALKNFADSPGSVYFRRELICWGDCVKLRYGSNPQDCPALWDRMRKYTEITAEIFHGIRIDNCHSTPIHVAEYMIDAARKIRPELYVFAELFTGSEHIDNIFVNRLGLTSLIREALNAWDSHELGRLVYMYGGESIASFTQPSSQVLKPSRAHALFYDITHDNESMIVKRSVHDVVPSGALVAMSSCAVGSNRGHDEMAPYHIHVVKEKRLYRKWALNPNSYTPEYVGNKSGIVKVKCLLNMLHQTMAMNGFDQVFVDQRTPDAVAVTRHNPHTHYSYILIAHTSFKDLPCQGVPPLNVEGLVMGIAIEAKPSTPEQATNQYVQSFADSTDLINGIEDYSMYVETDLAPEESACCEIKPVNSGSSQVVTFTDFPPGSIIVLRVKMLENADEACAKVREIIVDLSSSDSTALDAVIAKLELRSLSRVLFHCNEEELSDGLGVSSYDIPNYGKLTYCGIAGISIPMAKIRAGNDLGHPICTNLRDGDWYMDYASSRLQKHGETREIGDWLAECFGFLKKIPRYLIPAYFELLITLIHDKLTKACWLKMSSFIKEGSTFIKMLSLGTVAMCGFIKGATLPPLHPDVDDLTYSDDEPSVQLCLSMAAGLPHFSSGVMRCWGRDTFIAMHGLQLVTGQYADARHLILAFAGCLRHGLIPNLLGEGKISRYNCRDAVWFWLQCIQETCELDGYELLQMPVARIFPTDDSEPCPVGTKTQPLYDVIQEALQKHADGICFREHNAGPSIDSNMSDDGFNVNVGVDMDTGFVFGGNIHNCGTWMDKMGESTKAGTQGVPATPRDGSAVELVGLCKSTVSWLQRANNSGKYLYDGVFIKSGTKGVSKLTWSVWSKKLAENFEKKFFVGDDDKSHLVHKRYIYKDTVGASHSWCDYQLRPNFPLAMVYAPELFDVNHAWKALSIAQEKLLGPLGMKTLDPDDMQYRGDYDNSNDSTDASVAKGFNYHQGPEWLWPVGYFLRAKLYFARQLGPRETKETIDFIHNYLVSHQLHLEETVWCGLPELTNSNGSYCKDSCPIQAWSHATLLDLLQDLTQT